VDQSEGKRNSDRGTLCCRVVTASERRSTVFRGAAGADSSVSSGIIILGQKRLLELRAKSIKRTQNASIEPFPE
jgi:hypothetical protein